MGGGGEGGEGGGREGGKGGGGRVGTTICCIRRYKRPLIIP